MKERKKRLLNRRCYWILWSSILYKIEGNNQYFRKYQGKNIFKRYFSQAAPSTPSTTTLNFTFACPHQVLFKNKSIIQLSVPGVEGDFGISPQHVPTISQLRPGIVEISEEGKSEKYFVSGGFVFVQDDSTVSVNVIEAFPLEQLDPELAKEGYKKFTSEYSAATTEEAKAYAQIGIEVHSAMCHALGVQV